MVSWWYFKSTEIASRRGALEGRGQRESISSTTRGLDSLVDDSCPVDDHVCPMNPVQLSSSRAVGRFREVVASKREKSRGSFRAQCWEDDSGECCGDLWFGFRQ